MIALRPVVLQYYLLYRKRGRGFGKRGKEGEGCVVESGRSSEEVG